MTLLGGCSSRGGVSANEVTIRLALESETERVRAAYEAWGYRGGVTTRDVVFIADRAGDIVGIVRRTLEHGVVMLRGMHVAPQAQRHGIGKRLLSAFVERLGDVECFCVPHAHLTAFYGAVGFVRHPESSAPAFLRDRITEYRASGLDVLLMRRPGRRHEPWRASSHSYLHGGQA